MSAIFSDLPDVLDAIVSIKEKTSSIIWSESNRILSVMMDGDNEEQILKVAKSVKQIK